MFQCPLVTNCVFFRNTMWGADVYNSEQDGEEFVTINCSNCMILNEKQYQDIINKMVSNNLDNTKIFMYLNYIISKGN